MKTWLEQIITRIDCCIQRINQTIDSTIQKEYDLYEKGLINYQLNVRSDKKKLSHQLGLELRIDELSRGVQPWVNADSEEFDFIRQKIVIPEKIRGPKIQFYHFGENKRIRRYDEKLGIVWADIEDVNAALKKIIRSVRFMEGIKIDVAEEFPSQADRMPPITKTSVAISGLYQYFQSFSHLFLEPNHTQIKHYNTYGQKPTMIFTETKYFAIENEMMH